MSDKYLITASLLDAWKYLLTNEYAKYEDFLSKLNREEQETTQKQQDGFDFEEWAIENYEPTLNGQYQVKLSKDFKSRTGTEYLLYGRLDCLKNGKVYDYKHSSSYEVGNFFNKCQTSMYLELAPEATEMIYVIGKDKPNYQIKMEEELEDNVIPYNLFEEKYTRSEIEPISEILINFEEWLKTMGLWELYKEKWSSK